MVTEGRLLSEKQTRFSWRFLILQQAEKRDQGQAGWAGVPRLWKSPCGGNQPSWVWVRWLVWHSAFWGAGVSVRPLTLLLLQFPALRGLCASELSLKELRRKQVPGTHLEPIPQEQG